MHSCSFKQEAKFEKLCNSFSPFNSEIGNNFFANVILNLSNYTAIFYFEMRAMQSKRKHVMNLHYGKSMFHD